MKKVEYCSSLDVCSNIREFLISLKTTMGVYDKHKIEKIGIESVLNYMREIYTL